MVLDRVPFNRWTRAVRIQVFCLLTYRLDNAAEQR